MKRVLFYALVICLVCLCPVGLRADASKGDFTCEKTVIKVPNERTIYMVCPGSWPGSTPRIEVWKFPDGWQKDPRKPLMDVTGASVAVPDAGGELLTIRLDSRLEGGKKYLIVLKPATPRDGDPAKADQVYELSTEPKAVVTSSLAAADVGRVFKVNSPIAFAPSPNVQMHEEKDAGKATHPAEVQIPAISSPAHRDSPDALGQADARLSSGRRLRQGKATIELTGLKDVLGQDVTVRNEVELLAPPKGKEDANQYYQISHKAGPGAKPSVAVNVKANSIPVFPTNFWAGSYLVQPEIIIDVGTNEFARKSDDTIRLGMTSTRTSLRKLFFEGITYGPGISYETNLGFKKNNLLGTFESRFIPLGMFKTREMRRYEAASKSRKLSVNEIRASDYRFGSGFEFFLGAEMGGSLREQTFMDKAKAKSIQVPQYSILRFRPKAHAFIEYDRLTLDWSGTLRILGRNEWVAEEQPNKVLNLRRVRGTRGYMETTLSLGIDESKHMSLAITYKRGSQPPNFTHANTVVTGFIVKY